MTSKLDDLRGLSGRNANESATDERPLAMPPSRWKSRVLLPSGILAVLVILLLINSADALRPATPVRVIPTVLKAVEGSAGTITVQAPGWLEPDPHPHFVSSLAPGTVESILVLEGDPVEAGQVVAKLVAEDAALNLRRAEAELELRQSELAAAQAEAEAAQLTLDHLVDSTRNVGVADAKVAQARSAIAKIDADLAVQEAKLAEVRDEYDRKKQLIDSQAVSEATVIRLKLRIDAQQAAMNATAAQRDILRGKLAEAEAELAAANKHHTLLIEERRAAALAKAAVKRTTAAAELAAARRDEAALLLSRMEVRSPVSGVVLRRLRSPGSTLSLTTTEHSSHILHVYDPEHLQVRVDVPLADAAHIAVGQDAQITVEVLPDRSFNGRVSRIVHEADIQKNTVEVKVALLDPAVTLKPEMLARVRFLASPIEGERAVRERVFVPQRLIQSSGDSSAAMVVSQLVDQRGRAERRVVTTSDRVIGGWVEVESGLQAGDLLIAEPSDIKPGAHVLVAGEAGDVS